MLENLIRRLHEIRRGKVYFCRHLKDIKGPALVFLPIRDGTLFCGLAGFVSMRGDTATKDNGITERISQSLEAIYLNDISSILTGKADIKDFLNPQSLLVVEKELFSLKQNTFLQHTLCCGNGLKLLWSNSERLKNFIANEDA
ncbi:MAG TPA: hypothetical protein VMU10_05580, partial [Desulfomonilia bacterium]|nr:hypothetical protein [Desulfomonilia bacterium]